MHDWISHGSLDFLISLYKQGHKIAINATYQLVVLCLMKMPLQCEGHSRSRVISTSESFPETGSAGHLRAPLEALRGKTHTALSLIYLCHITTVASIILNTEIVDGQ